MLRQISRTDTVCSYQSGSNRTYLISEASSVLPSLSVSAFSLDVTNDFDNVQSSRADIFAHTNRFDEGLSSSCKEGLDVFDDPEYTDTVKSNDSTGSILRRSMSVPPRYTYKGQVRRHAREVFEDFIVPEKTEQKDEEDEDSDKPWRQTMEDLLERPDYIDSLQSTTSGAALLAKTATSITKAGQETKLIKEEQEAELKRKQAERKFYIKNLIILSITCFFLFGAYLSLRNLQSSINEDTGLAFYSLSSLYMFFFIGCIFAPSIIQRLRPKRTMLMSQFIILLYVGTNYYPTYYTLLPASFLQGFGLACFWTAHSTYLASIGISYAKVAGKNPIAILTKFNGIFFTFFGISQVLGNVISSTVLMIEMQDDEKFPKLSPGVNYTFSNDSAGDIANNTSQVILHLFNMTSSSTAFPIDTSPQCGAKYTPSEGSVAESSIDRYIVYIILGIFSVMIISGIFILVIFLDPLEGEVKKSKKSMCMQLAAVFRWFTDFRALCLVGLMIYSLLQMAFIFGEFTKAFVTCPIGVHMVGYTMLTISACSSVSSYLSGKVVRCLGRPFIMTIACSMQMILLSYMLFWDPTAENVAMLFVFMGLWGLADGILITQIVSIVGALFVDNKEPAFAGVKMCQSLGACLSLASAKYISCKVKICIIIGFLVVAMITYWMLEFSLWRESKAEVAAVDVDKKKKANEPVDV